MRAWSRVADAVAEHPAGGGGAVRPERQRGFEVLEPDDFGAVQQRVKQRDTNGVRFGACGRGAGEPGLAARQFVVCSDPALPRRTVEGDRLLTESQHCQCAAMA
jgi:hypothetical protein